MSPLNPAFPAEMLSKPSTVLVEEFQRIGTLIFNRQFLGHQAWQLLLGRGVIRDVGFSTSFLLLPVPPTPKPKPRAEVVGRCWES